MPRPALSAAAGLGPVLLLATSFAVAASPDSPAARRAGAPGPSSQLLDQYYQAFLSDRDVDSFRQQVLSRYSEADLGRLVQATGADTRRASVLALGLVGTFESNAALAHGLRDEDPVVRRLTEAALWSVWFRADTPDRNARLQQVRDHIAESRLDAAHDLASHLIEESPGFAEAYNQRAIARYLQGRYAESAEDCLATLERNPYHIGALSGLGQCYLRTGQRFEALRAFRRSLELQPHSEALRQTVADLEAGGT